MKSILERHMPLAQYIFDAACTVIFVGSMGWIYCLISGPWPVMP